jgi:maltose alpha-D-glucosyltransferase/alpha-amylase
LAQYFDAGNGMQMLFNFIAMNYLFGAMVRQDATLLADALNIIPAIHPIGQWVNFLRNHDELDLSRLQQSVQDDAFAAYAPEQTMRLYNRGIRRRLAPMLGGDQRRLELAYSLMFSLPGTPVLWYGDEIGMGEDLSQEERLSVRTPMQWSDDPNAGFSAAPPKKLVRPVISGGKFGYERVNVIEQQRVPESLMNWMERAIRNHKEHLAFGRGAVQVLGSGDRGIFAHRLDWDDDHMLMVHNLTNRSRTATVPVPPDRARQIFGNRPYQLRGRKQITVELDGYGYAWVELRQ